MANMYKEGEVIVSNKNNRRYFRKVYGVVGQVVFTSGDCGTMSEVDMGSDIYSQTEKRLKDSGFVPANREVEMTLEGVQELLGFKVKIKDEATKVAVKKEDL